MKKTILTLTIMMLFALSIFSQETIKYKDSENSLIEFKISADEYFIKIDNTKKQSFLKDKSITKTIKISENSYILKSDFALGNYKNRKTKLSQKFNNNISKVEPVLIYKDGVRQVCNGEVIIKSANKNMFAKLFYDYKIEITPNNLVKNQFIIKIKDINTFQLLELVSKLQTNSMIDFIEPNFIRLITPHTNDPFFNSQWSINNQGYLGGTIDADMDTEESWAIATGTGIKVAVIDTGVDLSHPDLASNLLSGYDATGENSNGDDSGNPHGTACAGIIAAVSNNNIGISGIAYNSKIIPVKVFPSSGSPSNSMLADGITWAYQNGADILSNSWGGGSPSSAINNAINNAVNNGRNGKGCIVLFSTGNYNTNVSYPATLNNVIAVGASSMCDERKSSTSDASLLVDTLTQPDANGTSCDGEWWWGSNFGNEVDIVAPGVEIFTTDISGIDVDNTGNYWSDFNGTSSACPNAAGVAALVLSVNPNFTQTQVREILETTTDKIGNTPYSVTFQNYGATQTWNNEVGYGRLNAYSAVQKALNYDGSQSHYITGPAQITPGYQAFYKFSEPYTFATNYVWSIPSGCTYHYCWDIIQGQGSSVLRIKAGKTGRQDITCKVYNGSTLIGIHYISVNVQNPYNGGGGNEDPCDGDVIVMPMVIYPPEPCENENMNINNISERLYFKKVVVYNFQGQKVIETKEKQEVDISHLSSGIYIIKAELSNGEIMTKKILRE